MDRYEEIVKAEEVISYADKKEYAKACEILDTINISRMKNYDDLITFAKVYIKNKRYDEAKEILVRIHEKTVTRRLLSMLIGVSAKMHNFVEAESYYEEYINLAPRDVNRFILRYKIDKAKGLNYDVLIHSLEQLKEYDLIEEWEYELAKLYHKAGYEDKCISECNTIIMMFGAGTIVEKAKLLRDHHIDTLSVNAGGRNVNIDSDKFSFDATTQLGEIIDQVKEIIGEESDVVSVESSDSDDYGEDINVSARIEEEYAKDNDKITDSFFEPEQKVVEIIDQDEVMTTESDNDEGMVENAGWQYNEEDVEEQYTEEQYAEEQYAEEQSVEEQYAEERYAEEQVAEEEAQQNNSFLKFTEAARQMTMFAKTGIDDLINKNDVLFEMPKTPEEEIKVPVVKTPETGVPKTQQTGKVVPSDKTEEVNEKDKDTAYVYSDEEDYGDGCRQLNLLDGFLDSDEPDNDEDEDIMVDKVAHESASPDDENDILNVGIDNAYNDNDTGKAGDIEVSEEVEEPGKIDYDGKEDDEVDEVEEVDEDDEIDDDFIKSISNSINNNIDDLLKDAIKEESESVKVIIPSGESTGLSEEEMTDEQYNAIMQKLAVLMTPDLYKDTSTEDIEENVFRNYYNIPSMRMNIRCALKNLKDNPVKGNFIVCGEEKTGRTTLAKMIARQIYNWDMIDTNKVARIDGEKFNGVDLEHKQEKLEDGCLIIQNAHNIQPSVMTSLITMIVHLKGRIVVFMETDYEHVAKLYLKTAEVREYFTSVVTTMEYTSDELLGFAKSYAAYKGFSFNESGNSAMKELIESVYNSLTIQKRVPYVLSAVEKSIRASLNRNNAGFGKPNADGLNVIERMDVEQQYM